MCRCGWLCWFVALKWTCIYRYPDWDRRRDPTKSLERWWWQLESKGEAKADRSALWLPVPCLDGSSDCARLSAPTSRCRRRDPLRSPDFPRWTDQGLASGNLPTTSMRSTILYRSAVMARPHRINSVVGGNSNLNNKQTSLESAIYQHIY